ncbi:M81 family metallopeptidase [Bradyrhizobium sp. 172]|uniref:M81 family metallopeptidase n=1 Tax=Bradyrhizobium sp. 172 TaxID=2782643 RepID=UPI001FFFDC3B|nr:M81 family metallopeptidase [Bradyrhizobium sp. 172]UPJ94907.1 M81 family metallopeptidase [Bradyrhizobium sp. 172]
MPFTVLTAEFFHETNTFSRIPADYASFVAEYLHLGDDAVAARGEANTPLAGFLDVGKQNGWSVIHTISASAEPCGPVTREAYDRIVGVIMAGASQHKPTLNGILLGLHGAMVTEFNQDGEGELLERLRALVGYELPIGLTLDPHANVTRKMAKLADIIVSYKTYPHVDVRECARQGAAILQRTMTGDIRPATIRAQRPMLEEINGGRTDVGPMLERIARARAYEQEKDVFAVSVNGAFGNADIEEVGPTVLVTAQGDFARHHVFAEELVHDIWTRRFENLNSYLTVEQAARQAKVFEFKSGPLVIADYADNPGGGGYGDSTNLLRAMIEADVRDACFGPMVDPEAAAELHLHKLGDRVEIRIGGKTDPQIGGGPIQVEGTLQLLDDGDFVGDGPMLGGLKRSWGATAVLRVGGIDILVTTFRGQMLDLQQFRSFGIDPAAKRVVGLKSMQHFRAAFEPIAGEVVLCDSGALCTPDLSGLPYRHVRRPIFPLDRDMEFRENNINRPE